METDTLEHVDLPVTGNSIAEAFTVNCTRKNWFCRQYTINGAEGPREQVSFNDRQGLVSLTYDVQTGENRRFSVSFNKAVASWGDYTNAIGKALQTVLSALEAGGLPFVAPVDPSETIVKTIWGGIGGVCTVEYEPKEKSPDSDIF